MKAPAYVTPKQPFFVTSATSYKKYVFNQMGIVHFYQCITGDGPCYAIPDGCADILFCCDAKHTSAEICGTVLSPESVLLQSHAYYFGVRFMPGFNPLFEVGNKMPDLVDQRISLMSLIHDTNALDQIWNTTDFHTQITAFLHTYSKIYKRAYPLEHQSSLVAYTSNVLMHSAGTMTVNEIAEESGYSQRYITQCFQEETGLKPKKFGEIMRFQSAISALQESTDETLTDIATDLGYYDQSHFIHEFKQYAGITPRQYQAQLKRENYHERIQIVS